MDSSHIARVRLVNQQRWQDIRSLIQERYTVEDEDALFLWEAEISNDLLDSHFTHMSESTLRNYAEDANRGVAFLKGHNWRDLPVGYSVSGTYEEGDKKRVVAGFYTVRGLSETNDLIARMQTGLLRDVSVGFHGGRMTCDLCGQDFWDCRHFPGLTYEEKKGDVVTVALATFTIEDARLSEVSGVFDGSTPEAMILKAQRSAKAGDLTTEQIELLEKRYRIALPASRVFPVADNVTHEKTGEKSMTPEERLINLRSFFNVEDDDGIATGITKLIDRANSAEERVAELEPQAKDGIQYRTDLVAEALAEGVRAQGNDFDKELYESTLNNAPLTVVKRMRDDWKKLADKQLPSGRSTVDDEQTKQTKQTTTSHVPDSAYA